MKILQDIRQCSGCHACFNVCPQYGIEMLENSEGFLYPRINGDNCTECGKCKETCHVVYQGGGRKPLNTYAAKNMNDEIRYESSSGGIFTLFAEYVINSGGVVFGAQFNENWEVVHGYAETLAEVAAFRGSKYVQSRIGNTYKQVKNFLTTGNGGKYVLFGGTPCQIAGLKKYLQRDYDNLLTIDFVCHGVPSPLVWRKYLNEQSKILLQDNNTMVYDIKFRDKVQGWNPILIFKISFLTNKSMCTTEKKIFSYTESSVTNSYMKGYLQNLYLRPSCHNCSVKLLKSGSDITIADYWGIKNILPEFDDSKGTSLVMVNTGKGLKTYKLLNKDDRETSYTDAIAGNFSIVKSVMPHKKRTYFFEKIDSESLIHLINRLTVDSLGVRLKRIIVVALSRLGCLAFIKYFFKRVIKI